MKKLLMGNEAFAHAALEAGVRVVAGYPGTPSSELIETIAKLHAQGLANGVHVEWSTNEKAALELLAAASYSGARCLFTCKQVGLNVASDPLMSLNYIGTAGGLVLFVADDPGPISSQTEQDTRRFASFAKLPVLDPTTPEEGFAMMKEAFELSEHYKTPVILRPTTRICHASTFFEIEEETQAAPLLGEGFVKDSKWVIFPRRAYEAHGEINERLKAIAQEEAHDALSRFNPLVEVESGTTFDDAPTCSGAEFLAKREMGGKDAPQSEAQDAPWPEDAACAEAQDAARPEDAASPENAPRLGIAAGGVSAAYLREALRMLEGVQREAGYTLPAYRFMQVGTAFPFPEELTRGFLTGLDCVLVYEELDHVIEDGLLQCAGRYGIACTVLGRSDGTLRDRGENGVEDALSSLIDFFARHGGAQISEAAHELTARGPQYEGRLPVRPPVLCAGCPHRGSFYAIKRALGKQEAEFCGDIGCYTLGNAAPLDAVDTCLCMGAGITMAEGFSVTEPQRKHIAFVGDSTFFASGLTGVVNAVYNGHDITVCVLDNATTAMTGAQPHPGTGVTLMGDRRPPIVIEEVLKALGVTCVVTAEPLQLEESVAAARTAIDFEGPSAIIFRSPCVQLIDRLPAAKVETEICTGCMRCITEIGCPALSRATDAQGPRSKDRGQARVDADQCNGCGLCAQLCSFGAIRFGSEDSQGDTAGQDEEGACKEALAHREAAARREAVAQNEEGAGGARDTEGAEGKEGVR